MPYLFQHLESMKDNCITPMMNFVWRFCDDGSSTLSFIGWEGHGEGDTSLNADMSTWSGAGMYTKITIEDAAKYLGMDVSYLTGLRLWCR
jgi:hypothetical protein